MVFVLASGYCVWLGFAFLAWASQLAWTYWGCLFVYIHIQYIAFYLAWACGRQQAAGSRQAGLSWGGFSAAVLRAWDVLGFLG